MQKLTVENNLSEIAFSMQLSPPNCNLRPVTPTVEVDLCGHATLASSHLIFEKLNLSVIKNSFKAKSGILNTHRKADLIELDFPVRLGKIIELTIGFDVACGCLPYEYLRASKNIAEFNAQINLNYFYTLLDQF
jgi:hypothetical protein